ncbi:hypothetical protein IWX83_000343 [Flavobacterium sp. CG_9.1]|nr:hypothetical protein [Flavobacterium sp. CG_9.1]
MAINMLLPTYENNSIIDMLMKLLATMSVANSFFGFSKSLEIRLALDLFSSIISSMSFCDKENKATPAPEINAEQKSKATTIARPKAKVGSII